MPFVFFGYLLCGCKHLGSFGLCPSLPFMDTDLTLNVSLLIGPVLGFVQLEFKVLNKELAVNA